MLSPMSVPRAGATSALLNGKLYMAGGYGEDGCLNSMEMYNPELDLWTQCSDSFVSRKHLPLSLLMVFSFLEVEIPTGSISIR